MEVAVRAEVTGAVLRIWPGATNSPDPYEAAIFVVGHDGIAFLKGAMTIKPAYRRAITETLKGMGFHTAEWSRRDARGTRVVRTKL